MHLAGLLLPTTYADEPTEGCKDTMAAIAGDAGSRLWKRMGATTHQKRQRFGDYKDRFKVLIFK